jgi:CRP/FNR family transcriptional regulator, polysaccharide utilization system transcription regulator
MGIKVKLSELKDKKPSHKIFTYLTDKESALINKTMPEVVYNEGEIIFKQGSPVTHLASIIKGLAKVYVEGLEKRNLILRYACSRDFIGSSGIFTDNLHHFTAVAVKDTTAKLINTELFKNLMQENNRFALGYIEYISEREIMYCQKLISLTQKQMHGRVAEALLYYSDKVYFSKKDAFLISRKDMADITALNKDTIGRILNDLQNSKIIKMETNSVKILNRNKLENISNKG